MKTYEKHEGTGTGGDLRAEDVLAEALAIMEPDEPYYEFHQGRGTGLELRVSDVLSSAEALLAEAWTERPSYDIVPAALPM